MTLEELKERQRWSLDQKIDHALGVIDQFLSKTQGNAYVSFSGGKDSTVLLDLCRVVKPDIRAVFCNTGNEFPDIVRFVRGTKERGVNVEIIYPKMKPQEIFDKYGFPLISKEQAQAIRQAKTTKSDKLRDLRLNGRPNVKKKSAGVISKKWQFLVYKPYMTSEMCCTKLKKDPFHKYEKVNNVRPILGIMAGESSLRQSNYLRNGGCNVFSDNLDKVKSMPLSIWTEDDIWAYIEKRKLKIADIYQKGAKRTGCMFCMFGAQVKGDDRLEMVYDLYPKMYDRFMGYTNGDSTYRTAARDVLAVNGLYLPDERPNDLFDL